MFLFYLMFLQDFYEIIKLPNQIQSICLYLSKQHPEEIGKLV